MAIIAIAKRPEGRGPNWVNRQTLTQSAATGFQTVNQTTEITRLGVGTATGHDRNRYSLVASGAQEGFAKLIHVTGTGEANLFLEGTATGLHVLTETDDCVWTQYLDGKWWVIQTSATTSSAT